MTHSLILFYKKINDSNELLTMKYVNFKFVLDYIYICESDGVIVALSFRILLAINILLADTPHPIDFYLYCVSILCLDFVFNSEMLCRV